jgi:hypothetical protein
VDYIEHANNNTLKTILALKYIFSLNWDGHYPEFVMKTDDDIYLNIPLLSEVLFEKDDFRLDSSSQFHQHLKSIFSADFLATKKHKDKLVDVQKCWV